MSQSCKVALQDWGRLRVVLVFRDVYPLLPFDCETVVTLAVSVELSDIPAVAASEAAEMLGVSTARVAQLCRDGSLNSWRVGSARMVSRDSIGCRFIAKSGAGRPRRASAEA